MKVLSDANMRRLWMGFVLLLGLRLGYALAMQFIGG